MVLLRPSAVVVVVVVVVTEYAEDELLVTKMSHIVKDGPPSDCIYK